MEPYPKAGSIHSHQAPQCEGGWWAYQNWAFGPGSPLGDLPYPMGLSLRVLGTPREYTFNRSSRCQQRPPPAADLAEFHVLDLPGPSGLSPSPCSVPGSERGRRPLLSRTPRGQERARSVAATGICSGRTVHGAPGASWVSPAPGTSFVLLRAPWLSPQLRADSRANPVPGWWLPPARRGK